MQVMLGMAKGVALCHRLGVVHRDINVHNFMFDGWGRVKLIDFASAAKVRACAACTHASSCRRLCVSVCALPTPAGPPASSAKRSLQLKDRELELGLEECLKGQLRPCALCMLRSSRDTAETRPHGPTSNNTAYNNEVQVGARQEKPPQDHVVFQPPGARSVEPQRASAGAFLHRAEVPLDMPDASTADDVWSLGMALWTVVFLRPLHGTAQTRVRAPPPRHPITSATVMRENSAYKPPLSRSGWVCMLLTLFLG